MWRLIRTRLLFLGESSGKRNDSRRQHEAMASVATAPFALSKLFQTSTAVKPTNKAKKMPNVGGIPRLEGLCSTVHREADHNPNRCLRTSVPDAVALFGAGVDPKVAATALADDAA
jgi:hypothetical protein